MRSILENQNVLRKKRKHPWIIYLFMGFFLVFISTFLISSPSSEQIQTITSNRSHNDTETPEESVADTDSEMDESKFKTVQGNIKKNQTFYELMTDHGVTPQKISQMASAAKGTFNLRKLLPGKGYELIFNEAGVLRRVKYFVDQDHIFVMDDNGDDCHASIETIPHEMFTKKVEGVITSTLFEAVQAIGEGQDFAVKLSEIFAWDIDFNFDIRKGDRFTVIIEEKWRDGKFANYGNILAAKFVNQGDNFHAIYYEGSDGESGYYMPDGGSVQKQFLRSPLKFNRISSKFTYKRYHPVLKRYRPHLGVDYVAPSGTPIHAAGDGKVIFAGRKGGNGNFVKIRHNQIYMTGYLHLSRIARGIRSGKRVKQGQVIGYVGKTGLATGPHLCYRFYKYGKFVNPLTVKFPSASPVHKKDRAAFAEIQETYMERLQRKRPVYLVDQNGYLMAGSMAKHNTYLS